MRKTICMLALCVCLVSGALADDFNPPAWYDDDDPSNTRQAWEFDTDTGTSFAPEEVDNPFGSPSCNIGGYADWIEAFVGGPYGLRTGVLQAGMAGDYIEFEIPNDADPLKYKEIVVLLTVATTNEDFVEQIETTVTATGSSAERTDLIQGAAADGWYYIEDHWTITPQPDSETYRLELKSGWNSGTALWLDEAVIYTHCVPEPATMSLVALGGLALLRRRRR
jgi:hypothetical protein